jgi:hypothetical protein
MAKKKKKKRKKHFTGTGSVTIHTAREPKCHRGAACEFRNQGRKGKMSRYGFLQDHHVIPVAMTIMYQVEDAYNKKLKEFNAIYRDQDYCVNNKENLIWMATKPTYLAHDKRSKIWDLNFPCHTVNHPAYNTEVLDEIRGRIFQPILEAVEADQTCVDPPDAVEVAFTEIEKEFRQKLHDRGKRPEPNGGTRYAIEHRDPDGDGWHAFSMADSPDCTPAVLTFLSDEIPKALKRK